MDLALTRSITAARTEVPPMSMPMVTSGCPAGPCSQDVDVLEATPASGAVAGGLRVAAPAGADVG